MDYDEKLNIKCAALSYAIKSACGVEQSEFGVTTNPDKLIEAAKKFEAYLKETNNV